MKLINYESLTSLKEIAKSIKDAEKENLGLVVFNVDDSQKRFFLYNTEKLLKIENLNDRAIDFKIADCIYGASQIRKYKEELWEVQYTGALKGWGVLLYDIMLSNVKTEGLCPDQTSVSTTAKKVWETYYTKRNNEITTMKIDSYRMYPDDILDRIYYLKPNHYVKMEKLKSNHKKCKSQNPEIFKKFKEKLVKLIFNIQSGERKDRMKKISDEEYDEDRF